MRLLSLGLLVLAPLFPDEEVNHATITGRFVDAEGNGVGDGRVLHRVWPGAEFPCRTDDEGRFEARVEWAAHHRDTWYSCAVERLGFARWEFHGDLQPGDELDLGTVALEPGGGAEGIVRDEKGPLADALILIMPLEEMPEDPVTEGERGPGWGQVLARGNTDEAGRFRIEGLPLGTWGVWAHHERCWWTSGSTFEVRRGELATLAEITLKPLPPRQQIHGVVLGPNDEPVEGVEVTTGLEQERTILEIRSVSDEEGRFALYLPWIPDQRLDISAEPATDQYWGADAPRIRAGSRDVLIQLPRTIEIDIRVVDTEGAPVETYGWTLTVREPHCISMQGEREESHPNGCATIRIPEGMRVEIETRTETHEDVELDVTERIGEEILFELLPIPAIVGFVTFEGRPVEGAHVDLPNLRVDHLQDALPDGWDGLDSASSGNCAETDADGSFRIPNRLHYMTRVRAWKEGYAPVVIEDVQIMDSIYVELRRGGALTGRIRLPEGGDPAGIPLRLHRQKPQSYHCTVGRRFRTLTDVDGGFRFDHLDPGPWMVSAEISPGMSQALGWLPRQIEAGHDVPLIVEVREGQTTSADLDLTVPEEICTLRIRLAVGDEIVAGYAYLRLENEKALRIDISEAVDDGWLTLHARTPGTYRLVVCGGHSKPGLLVTDLVSLEIGDNSWEKVLTEDALTGKGIRLDPD